MKFKQLKYGLLITLLYTLGSNGFAFQKDSRGFPVTQTPGPSFGMPSVNHPSPLGAPLVTIPPITNQPIKIPHRQHFFYFDYYGYPYYATPSYDNSFYYSTSPYTDDMNSNDIPQSTNNFRLPYGKWVPASNGYVPDQAYVYQTSNGGATYYCRAEYRYKMVYGVLTRNEGCLIQNQSVILRLKTYEVLISY